MTSASTVSAMVPQSAKVLDRREEAPGVVTLTLEPPPDYEWAPGQFNMLYSFGHGEAAISVSGDPAEPGRLLHTVRNVGAVSRGLSNLAPGDHLGLRGPFGFGWPLEAAEGKDVVIMAGGLGLAPLRPLIYHLAAKKDAARRVIVLYGTRDVDSILYPDELAAWDALNGWDARLTVDHAPKGWTGHVGVVTDLLDEFTLDPANTVAYLCGPEVMMRFGARALEDRGLSPSDIFVSLERNMKCAIAHCGRCQFGSVFICRDGPVFAYDRVSDAMMVREL